MRTPRSGANKKTPPAKKNAASETVPRTRGGRGGGRRSNPRGAAASVIVDPPSVAASQVDADLIDAVEESEAIDDLASVPSLKLENVNEETQILIKEREGSVSGEVDEKEELVVEKEHEEEEKTVILDEQEREEPPFQEKVEEPCIEKEHEEEKKSLISDQQESEEPLIHEKGEKQEVDKGKEIESDSFTDGDASKSEFVENLEKEEEKNLEGEAEEVEIPGHEDSAGVEKENENLGEEEQVEMLEVIKERNKKKEREIFVGGLDRDASEDDVRKAFESIGVVEEIRLHKDLATNKNKGFAFVMFVDKEQANRALLELKNPIINGKKCGIAPSEDNDTLFVGNICNTWTKEAIKHRLKDFGVEGIESINLVGDSQNEALSRGFAFVEFSCHEYAMNAYKRLQKPDVILGHPEWTAKVAFAEPLREPDPEVMAQVKSVFVDGMSPAWDEDRVKELFKDYGEIEGIVLARNMPTAKRMDFGFVNFSTHEAAVACANALNDKEIDDGKAKIKVRARLANPLPKTQAVKGGMRGGFRIGHGVTSSFSRFGRGFGRGRASLARGGFQGSRGSRGFRGFPFNGHARGGRFPFFLDDNRVDSSNFRFHSRQPFMGRGGRAPFRGNYEGVNEEFPPRFDNSRPRFGGFGRGRGRHFQARGEPFPFEGGFRGPSHIGPFAEDSYYHGNAGHGVKRPFPVVGQDGTNFVDPGSRVRPRYDLANPTGGDVRYQDHGQGSGSMYPQEYYAPNYGNPGYPPVQGGENSGGRYYY